VITRLRSHSHHLKDGGLGLSHFILLASHFCGINKRIMCSLGDYSVTVNCASLPNQVEQIENCKGRYCQHPIIADFPINCSRTRRQTLEATTAHSSQRSISRLSGHGITLCLFSGLPLPAASPLPGGCVKDLNKKMMHPLSFCEILCTNPLRLRDSGPWLRSPSILSFTAE
jgi:hypothetical protein